MPRPSREPEFDLVEIPPQRKAIGDRVSLSRREKPTFDMLIEVRADALVAAREQYKVEAGERVLPTYNDIVIKAVGDLLPQYRALNAWVDEAGVKLLKPINVGFAAATPQGVVLPTVFETLGVADPRLEPGGLLVAHVRKGEVVATEVHQPR